MRFLGKTVYVFGAGASAHQGAPLLNNFLDAAQNLCDSRTELYKRASFEAIFKWLRSMRASNSGTFADLNNLEDVFSLIALLKETGNEEGENLFPLMGDVIFETLEKTIRFEESTYSFREEANKSVPRHSIGSMAYSQFIDNFEYQDIKRSGLVGHAKFQPDSIITFNYDLLLEKAFADHHLTYTYHLDEGKRPGYSILKLHGSMNWYCHPGCSKAEGSARIRHYSIEDSLSQKILGGEQPKVISFSRMRAQPCPDCNHLNEVAPTFIPPTWSKNAETAGVGHVWQKALDEVRQASQMVIVGYSLPPTDTFFKYLLALGLKGNGELKRVIIVDPDLMLRDRYAKIFGTIPVYSCADQNFTRDPGFNGHFETFPERMARLVYD